MDSNGHAQRAPTLTLALCTCINSEARLAMARWRLNNLLLQVEKYAPDVELLVVENGSRALEEAVKNAPARYFFDPRAGYAHARNTAITLAMGEIIAVCDDDDLDYEARPAAIMAAFAAHPDAQIYYSGVHVCDAGFGVEETVRPDGSEPAFLPREQRIFHPTVAYKKSAIMALGGYREDLFFALEDLDLLWRAQKAGWQWIADPTVLVRYRKHRDQQTTAHAEELRNAQALYLAAEGF